MGIFIIHLAACGAAADVLELTVSGNDLIAACVQVDRVLF